MNVNEGFSLVLIKALNGSIENRIRQFLLSFNDVLAKTSIYLHSYKRSVYIFQYRGRSRVFVLASLSRSRRPSAARCLVSVRSSARARRTFRSTSRHRSLCDISKYLYAFQTTSCHRLLKISMVQTLVFLSCDIS